MQPVFSAPLCIGCLWEKNRWQFLTILYFEEKRTDFLTSNLLSVHIDKMYKPGEKICDSLFNGSTPSLFVLTMP